MLRVSALVSAWLGGLAAMDPVERASLPEGARGAVAQAHEGIERARSS